MIDRKERRCSPRTARRFPMRYQTVPVAGKGYSQARVEDLSPEGLRFRCSDEVRVRSGMLVELQLSSSLQVHFIGRAAWVRELPHSAGFEVGGRLEEQSTWGRKAIERFLQHGDTSTTQ